MIDPKQLVTYVVRPVLEMLALPTDVPDCKAAIELLMGTAMQESECGMWLHQISGPACGIWQMEPATAVDLFDWVQTTKYARGLHSLMTVGVSVDTEKEIVTNLIGNLYFACAMSRLYYYRIPAPLPKAGDIDAQAAYYKQYYNTPAGAATVAQYKQGWQLIAGQVG